MREEYQSITRKELAAKLGISYITLYRWLLEQNYDLPSGRINAAHQLEIIRRYTGRTDIDLTENDRK